jgi:hypothetical protein
MLELTVLLISIAVILVVLYIKDNIKSQNVEETFQNYYLSACPSGYKSFYDNNGDIICCNGEIIANKCISDNQCKLNGVSTPDLPNCVEFILKDYAEKAKKLCPSNLPNYFEDKSKNFKGCTSGLMNDTLTGPQRLDQPKCLIYSSFEQNYNSKDSCDNLKLLDSAQCFGNNCTKELIQPVATAPPLVAIGFTDSSGMHRVAYTKQSMENFLNVVNPQWQNQGIDLSKNINVAEVSKAFYVDKTMDQSQIQF